MSAGTVIILTRPKNNESESLTIDLLPSAQPGETWQEILRRAADQLDAGPANPPPDPQG